MFPEEPGERPLMKILAVLPAHAGHVYTQLAALALPVLERAAPAPESCSS